MEEKKEIIKEQLGYIYQLYQANMKNRSAIRNWCIVMWLGLAVALLKFFEEPNSQNYPILPLIIFLPVILFWFTEAIYGGQTKVYREQIKSFERKICILLKDADGVGSEPADLCARSHYEAKFKLVQKLCALGHVFLGSGTIASFYVPMFFISILFIKFFLPNYFNLKFNIPINIWSLVVIFIIIFALGHLISRYLEEKAELKE